MDIDYGRVERIKEYVMDLKDGDSGVDLYQTYKEDLDSVTANEAFEVFSTLLAEGEDAADILGYLGKVVNVFGSSLESGRPPLTDKHSFLQDLEAENTALQERLNQVRGYLTNKSLTFAERKSAVAPLIAELQHFEDHYAKKENILFPMMEKADARFEGTSIMWALHDQVRKTLKDFQRNVQLESYSERNFNKALGEIFFSMLGLKYKEENILFPAALSVLTDEEWGAMYQQSMEYDFPFIDKEKEEVVEEVVDFQNGYLKTDTGTLKLDEVLMIFNTLPVDMTYVDENNKVRYFSKAKERIFPRSKAVIGRDVKNCHPPASVHVVEDIVEAFRNREEETASFWIEAKGKKLLIQYFALWDDEDNFRGVLEVSQDITQIQQLEGERRVLDWSKD